LRSGALVIPIDRSLIGQEGYYLVYPEEKANLPAVTAFRDWLLAECAPVG
jgi:LysR family glycine cleavage system transcriptional activator